MLWFKVAASVYIKKNWLILSASRRNLFAIDSDWKSKSIKSVWNEKSEKVGLACAKSHAKLYVIEGFVSTRKQNEDVPFFVCTFVIR